MVKSVGVVAETKKIADHLTRLGLRALEEDEVLHLIEAAIRDPLRNIDSSQVVTGIPPSFVPSDFPISWNKDVRFSGLERLIRLSGEQSDLNKAAATSDRPCADQEVVGHVHYSQGENRSRGIFGEVGRRLTHCCRFEKLDRGACSGGLLHL